MSLQCRRSVLGSLLALLAAAPARSLEYQFGDVSADLTLAAAAQGALYQDGPGGQSESGDNLLALARLNLEWISDAGRVYGLRAETGHGTRRSEDLGADEL